MQAEQHPATSQHLFSPPWSELLSSFSWTVSGASWLISLILCYLPAVFFDEQPEWPF